MNKNIEAFIKAQTIECFGSAYEALKLRRSGVGCINETWEIYGDGLESLFFKLGNSDSEDMYLREKEGLSLLSAAQKLRVPKAHIVAKNEECAFIMMEFIPLQPLRLSAEIALGEALAELHHISNDQYGLDSDNYIGRTEQKNGFCDDWWAFFCENRLAFQLNLAEKNGMRGELEERIASLIDMVPAYFNDHQPKASLLHGDLWSGNVSSDLNGTPVIFDPAVYYGDAETDIAMSQMFQPLGNAVYEVYYNHFPPQPGHPLRKNLYDLYHWLNHFNLFGVNYLGQVERAVDSLLLKIL